MTLDKETFTLLKVIHRLTDPLSESAKYKISGIPYAQIIRAYDAEVSVGRRVNSDPNLPTYLKKLIKLELVQATNQSPESFNISDKGIDYMRDHS